MNRLYLSPWNEKDFEEVLLLYERTDPDGLAGILDSLDAGFDAEELKWAGKTLGWRSFHPGRYEIGGHLSYSEFLSKLARGMQDPARVTILPGSEIARLSQRLSVQLRPDSVSFLEIFSDSSAVALDAGLSGEELFARMLPDTYDMYWTSSPENVIRRVLAEFNRAVVEPYARDIERHPLSLDEIIILASIVEWEARTNEEKPRISGLYLNRLNNDMKLQADPTVIYAVGERRRLLFEDYRIDHPYNTYQIEGLPPGPVTNPDLVSIRSVLFPEEHDYLYMVATPEGTHRFSETFEEHRQAGEEWRKWLREQYRIREERENREEEK